MTPAQKAQQTAYNEFIADFVERHGECKATRDEAHEVADWVVDISNAFAAVEKKFGSGFRYIDTAHDFASQWIDLNTDIDGKDEAKFLASCAIAAALEVVG